MMTITITDKNITCAKDLIQLKDTLMNTFQTNDITIEHNRDTQSYIIKLNNIQIPQTTTKEDDVKQRKEDDVKQITINEKQPPADTTHQTIKNYYFYLK